MEGCHNGIGDERNGIHEIVDQVSVLNMQIKHEHVSRIRAFKSSQGVISQHRTTADAPGA